MTAVLTSNDQDWQAKASARKQASVQAIDRFAEALKVGSIESKAKGVKDVSQISLKEVLSERDLEITDSNDVGVLLEKLKTGEWKALDVITAYSKRAVIASRLVNCLTETFFDRALERAKELDDILAKTGKPVGPLHGLPISLKDQIDVEGVECNMGYVGWIGRVSKKNAALVEILIKAGAVLYCKTNIPQSLMAGESNNHVYGRTVNPYNIDLSCGGSSGGEGALVAMRGSPIGVGSDIGGSIRIPSGYCGLYGLRPSYNRVPYQDATNSMIGFEGVPSVLGPISSSVSGLKPFLQAVLAQEPWRLDPYVAYRPWNEDLYQLKQYDGGKKLCFGLWRDDGVCRPAPPYARALEMTKKALEAQGHEVIEWSFNDTTQGANILIDMYCADGDQDIQAACDLSGEPRIYGRLISGDQKELTTSQYWALHDKRRKYLKQQLDDWEKTKDKTSTGRSMDAVIGPVGSSCPELHGKPGWIWYTGLGNLHDYSVGVFPVTKVDLELDPAVSAQGEPRSPFEKTLQETYDPKTYLNAPIGLQCIGRKGQDEAVIRMTEIIDAALKKQAGNTKGAAL